MSDLNLHPNFGAEADAFYAELIAAQAGLSDDAAADWMARLTLILCNHIGDRQVLRQAFALARESADRPAHDLPGVPPHAPR
ncbi:DUF2783 domain-containing protein [Pelomonas sp. UHG3]|uniref:DUF2783 domain-containing protein n=1 Tax=Roseateles hydrophilus TaxID=2975054 RepID=A0ACC6CDD5_9BURK|nr:DUF2783 domain-containing protein [Pelomonas sp. UHG3]MCY4746433.1 DUF2783 domain-containing protein [Pelomonas sp. UHG3]